MRTNGRTLFFNEATGEGIIIIASKQKISFTVNEWNDFEIMPSKGLEVVFEYDKETASNIISKESFELEEEHEEILEVEKTAFPEIIAKNIQVETLLHEDGEEFLEEMVAKDLNEESFSTHSQHFEEENEVAILEDDDDDDEVEVNEEIVRPESITNTITLATAINNYFKIISTNVSKRKKYQNLEGRIDYMLIRRFIWTTFHNLTDIDIKIVTPKIKALSDDLKRMEYIYDDFTRKTKYPKLAYDEVFLACQDEYKKIKDGAESTIEKLNRLRMDEKKLGGVREVKKKALEDEIQTEQFSALEGELKSLNGAYVDVVHMMAELDERYQYDMKLLKDFEQEYRAEFYAEFDKKAKIYKYDLTDILNAQAFIFDAQLWSEARKSKTVKAHFKTSSISGNLNTKTYLKYYLSTQDEDKATGETQKLFDLYEKLILSQKENILIVVKDLQDALEFESAIKINNKQFDIKSFVDELSAIKWAMKNSVALLIVAEQLSKARVENFLDLYNRNVLSSPKVIVLGNKPKTHSISVQKLLPDGVSPRVLAKAVESLIGEEEKKVD